MSKYKNKQKIHKDAYFRIEHFETRLWLGFEDAGFSMHSDVSHNMEPKALNYFKDVNTYKFRKSNF